MKKKRETRRTANEKKPYSRPVVRSSGGFNTVVLATDCQGACQIQWAGITT
ncbi:MAG: hypothetical protein KC609_09365 [Myxococcales bacterium]|nr:hypothetical protein [Myxococcales bacterium]